MYVLRRLARIGTGDCHDNGTGWKRWIGNVKEEHYFYIEDISSRPMEITSEFQKARIYLKEPHRRLRVLNEINPGANWELVPHEQATLDAMLEKIK